MDLSYSSKPKTRQNSSRPSATVSLDSIGPVTHTTISLEYASLRHKEHCPLGMYIVPSAETLMIWDAVLFVHQGYYMDATLKFRLTFPSNYPEHPPVVQFLTDIFHPLISQQTGVFNLAPRFRAWRPKEHHVFDVLHWIKAAFKKHALDELKETDCLNKEAFRYHETTSSFAALATQSSMLSQSSTISDGDHTTMTGRSKDGLLFQELTLEQLSTLRSKVGLREWDQESV